MSSPAGERGSATVETALVLPVLIGCALLLVAAALFGSTRIAVTEAARVAARAVAAGQSAESARQIGERACACGASIRIDNGPWVRVTASANSGPAAWLPGIRLSATVEIPSENTVLSESSGSVQVEP
ncbi:MAG: TadE family type IV pilus minor pilin [Bowdeniella nasicola]|nr:TadE family type IV pilus minor pilin [Bowdeniella nasicola]